MKRKAQTAVKQKKLSNREFLEFAKRKSGVKDACIISPSEVETAAWVRLKCQFGCDGFGLFVGSSPVIRGSYLVEILHELYALRDKIRIL